VENKTAIYALTGQGLQLGRTILEALNKENPGTAALFAPGRLLDQKADFCPFETLAQCLKDNFALYDGHIVISAIGLTVRLIAPLLKNKKTDPAVVGIGQDGRFAVSLLSGHLGGGNALSQIVAQITGGQAVITTSTDLSQKPALEVLARENNLIIQNWDQLAPLARRLTEGEIIPFYDPFGFLSPGLVPWPDSFVKVNDDFNNPLLAADYRLTQFPADCLILRPQVLTVGLGGHKDADFAELLDLFELTLSEHKLSPVSVKYLATIDRRAQDKGFLALAEKLARPLLSYNSEQLNTISAANPSEVVKKNVGAASVCEAAALLAARTGRLLVPKNKALKVTCAVALIDWPSSAWDPEILTV
jgi:cobalt-precorrin 5A hydrolase